MLRRWAVRENIVSGAYLRMYLSDCLQIRPTFGSELLLI